MNRIAHLLTGCALGLTGLALGAVTASAQPAPPQWYALDSMPSGTPPTVVLETSSDLQGTTLNITIHGFYYETVVQDGISFRRLTFEKLPDEAAYRVVGRPELPALHHSLGNLLGGTMGNPTVQVIEEATLPGFMVYPYQPPQEDHEGDPAPPFQWDQAFYQQTTVFPPSRCQPLGALGKLNGLPMVGAESYPLRLVPGARLLYVAKHFRLSIPHPGSGAPATRVITRRQTARFKSLLPNWNVIDDYLTANLHGLAGDYLIITAPQFLEEIDPLADQKKVRNYAVDVVTTDDTGDTAGEVQAYIADWWSDGDPGRDHYVLLVGDTPEIPMATDEDGSSSDKVYACIDGLGGDGLPDPYPEVLLGRLSCDTEAECTDMVSKILNYEDGEFPFGSGFWLDDVLLVAHKEEYPNKYTAAHEVVADADYSTQPVFHKRYGGEGATDANVIGEIDAGRGVVAYRGHGSSSAWTSWNLAVESFNATDVGLIDNGSKTPLVFGIACTNSALNTGDCVAEAWMETTERAVAYYGASNVSGTSANHILDRELFEAIYDDDIVILADALAAGECGMIAEFPSSGERNAWRYLLLGDPEMKVWRENPDPIVITGIPPVIPPDPFDLRVRVLDQENRPLPFAVVALFKDGDFAANRYSDADGWAEIPIDPSSPGLIEMTVFTEFDSKGVAYSRIQVQDPTAGAPGAETGITSIQLSPARPNPLQGQSALAYALPKAGPVRVTVMDVAGRRVATLVNGTEAQGWHTVVWDGKDDAGTRVSTGVYFARLEAGGETRRGRILVVQ